MGSEASCLVRGRQPNALPAQSQDCLPTHSGGALWEAFLQRRNPGQNSIVTGSRSGLVGSTTHLCFQRIAHVKALHGGHHEMARNDTFSSHLLHISRRPEPKVVNHGAVGENVFPCQIFLTQFALSRIRDWISAFFPTIIDSLSSLCRRFARLPARSVLDLGAGVRPTSVRFS